MADQLGWAEFKLGDTESALDSILAYTQRINTEINDLTARARAMFRQDKRKDPIYDRERQNFLDKLIDQIKNDRKLYLSIKAGASVSISADGKAAEELSRDDLGTLLRQAMKIIDERLEQDKYTIEVKKPANLTPGELEKLVELVAEGGEVAEGVGQRMKTADAIGLVRYEKSIVGTAALKKPTPGYRRRVFDKAKSSLSPDQFSRELGWIFLKQEHRAKGQMRPLIEGLMVAAGDNGVFATTRASNDRMQRILSHQKFARHGEANPSIENAGEELLLFIRPGAAPAKKMTK